MYSKLWLYRSGIQAVICACTALLLAGAQAQKHEWTSIFGQPVYVDSDFKFDVAAGPNGTVYAVSGIRTATHMNDFNVVKYGSDGTLLWARQLGDTTRSSTPVAMRVDAAGRVYVTGQSYTTGGTIDFLTVKYDVDGNVLWARAYDSAVHAEDLPAAIAIDPSGNIYVTGVSIVNDTDFDSSTVKYDADGNQLWGRWYDGIAHLGAGATTIAVDASGNASIAGWSLGDEGDGLAAWRYDADGNLLWERFIGEASNTCSNSGYVAVDAAGNTYASSTACSTSGVAASGIFTVKFDANGKTLWSQRFDSPLGTDSLASAMATDSSGNVYVTGASATLASYWAFCTIKYDTDGNQLWARIIDPSPHIGSVAWSVAIGGDGTVFVGGYTGVPNGNGTSCVVAYDASGDELWTRLGSELPESPDLVARMALGSDGSVFVASMWWTYGIYGGLAVAKYSSLPPTTVMGRVALQSYNGPTGIMGTLDYRAPGSNEVVHSSAVFLDASGYFRDPLAPLGTYDIVCTFMPNWLRNVKPGVEIGPWGAVADFALTNGDANGDDTVNLLDLATVLRRFGTSGPPPATGDLNWDGTVNLLDLIPVISNFGAAGDP